MLLKLFQEHADLKNAAWQHAYMRHQFPFLGIKKPLLITILKPIAHTIPETEILNIWNNQEREFQYAAMWLLRYRAKTALPETLSLYEQLLREKSWWDTVDEISAHLVGPLVLRFPDLHNTIDTWTTDPHLWIRRSSIIYQLFFKDRTDRKRLFDHCLELSHEKDFFIRKAIGWALRQYRKTATEEVDDFLAKFGTRISPLSLREAQKNR